MGGSREAGHRQGKACPERPGTKTHRSRREVPLTSAALEAVDSLPARLDTVYVFGGPKCGPFDVANFRKREWGPAIESAGVATPARLYDLRSTFASNALAAGITVYELARITGTSVGMIERHYGALLDGSRGSLLERWRRSNDASDSSKVVRIRQKTPAVSGGEELIARPAIPQHLPIFVNGVPVHGYEHRALAELACVRFDPFPGNDACEAIGLNRRSEVIAHGVTVEQVDRLSSPDRNERPDAEVGHTLRVPSRVAALVLVEQRVDRSRHGQELSQLSPKRSTGHKRQAASVWAQEGHEPEAADA